MNILDWFDSIVVNGIFSVTDEDDASVNWNDQSWFEENIAACRKNTPIFGNELSFDEFCDIAHKAAKKIKRIKRVRIDGAIITCTVESQSGITDWDFTVDFNDWGHVSGVFWLSYGNLDSTIPRAYADKVSLDIIYLLMERKVERKNHSAIVNYDIFSGQIEDEQEFRFKNLFLKPNRQLITDYSTTDLICEHAFYALCCLKKNGFKNVILVPVKDIDEGSDNYLFEVESISVAGKDSWEKGAIFLKNSKVTIYYHGKKEIKFNLPSSMYKRKNYNEVINLLEEQGFSEIYTRPIHDLTMGWFVKNGSVDDILVERDEETPIRKNSTYYYDDKLIICYHTF